jgi:putative glutamine amidotransferase
MSRFLSRVGVMPILLPDVPWPELEQYLNEMDGFVFQGGADISPKNYNEGLIENGRWPGDYHRDQYELKIMDWAFKNKKPILAICRGFQLANVYFGGSLYQDLKLQTNTSIEHRNAELYDKIFHEVECTAESILAKIYNKQKLTVNSVHHQGIKSLGKNLVVDAICPEDKIIEAFHYENMEEHFVLAVQWHPEFSHTIKDIVINPEPLINYFLKRLE